MLRARAGFTLIELMLAIAIAIILLMMALPSMSGISAEKELRASFEKFDGFARQAQMKAVSQQRSWVIVWEKERILLAPEAPTGEELQNGSAEGQDSIPVSENDHWTVNRPASLLPPKDTPQIWTFWRSGTCEPLEVTYEGPVGWWTAQYNPLTGHGEIIKQEMKR